MSRLWSMERVSAEVRPRATKTHANLLGALGSVGQNSAAEAMGLDASWISEAKKPGGDLEKFAALVAAAGMKLVPENLRLYQPERIAAILELARLGIDRAAEPSEFGDNL